MDLQGFVKVKPQNNSLKWFMFIQSDSESNADQKWAKHHDDLMHPYRVIAPQSSKKVLT